MAAYTIFADVYDNFMSEIPYKKWADMIGDYLAENKYNNCPVLELGCGTGNLTLLMAEKGYQMTGVDISSSMLKIAINKSRKSGHKITFSLQDMRALELQDKYPVVISVCDSMNYLENVFDMKSAFEGVHDALEKGGQFIFDMKTESFYERLGDSVFTDENDAGYYIWENEYDKVRRNNNYFLTFFIKNFKGLYKKYTEEHTQHAFTEEEVRLVAEDTGFNVKYVLGMDLNSPADYNAERVYYILERK